MKKDIDLKSRLVEMYDVNTGMYEDEIASYLDKNMRVRFYSASFCNNKYVFIGTPADNVGNSITVISYRRKNAGENVSVIVE